MKLTDFDGSVSSFCVVLDVKASNSIKKIAIQSVSHKAAPISCGYLIEILLGTKCRSLDKYDRF